MNITTSIETITPEIAKQYLGTNADNQRNLTKTHMIHLAQQMNAGQWILNGEPIIFSNDGRLIDGQHRLSALVYAKANIQFLVVRGVSPDGFMTIDKGKMRTNSDIMSIEKIPNSAITASVVTGCLNYRRARSTNQGQGGSLNSYIRPSSTDLLKEYKMHVEEYQFAAFIGGRCRKITAPSNVGIVAALAHIVAKHDKQEIAHFWTLFQTGAGLSENDPILHLRNRLITNGKSSAKLSSNMKIMLMIKAWNLYAKGKSCGVLRVIDNEPCPEIL